MLKIIESVACLGKAGSKGSSKRRLSSKVLKTMHTKLKRIRAVFPSVKGWCIIDKDGHAIAENSHALGDDGDKIADRVVGLRNAAFMYGKSLAEPEDLSIVHIEGDEHFFSFYVGQEHILAFFSDREYPTNTNDVVNFHEQDERMRALVEELFASLQPQQSPTNSHHEGISIRDKKSEKAKS